MNSCLKTGCTVRVNDKVYHGDLFRVGDELVLKGVPPKGEYDYAPNMAYHCEASECSWVHENESGYSEYLLKEVFMKEAEYEFHEKWNPRSVCLFAGMIP